MATSKKRKRKKVAYWERGDYVQAGKVGTDEHETGRVSHVHMDDDGREIVTVAWDGGHTTDIDVDDVNNDLRGISVRERDKYRFAPEE